MDTSSTQRTTRPPVGVLVGGTGLIGGTLLHAFKRSESFGIRVLAPNSKELSLRVLEDVRSYFERVRPAFIINCAVAAIDSDPEMTFEVTARGSVYLAQVALELGIPYIHFSSASVMPKGRALREDQRVPLTGRLSNYAKGKLLAEHALEQMHATHGLDCTIVRLAIVYGAHDHKIQGFHRLLFSLADGSMPALLTRPETVHSYSNAKKLPRFIAHVLANRAEFSGETIHFVDPEPVRLGELMLRVKELLGSRTPRALYVPYGVARLALALVARLVRPATLIGIEARTPAESVFLRDFYESQVLSADKLLRSSYRDESPGTTVFSELREILDYYLRRWTSLNLIQRGPGEGGGEGARSELFRQAPELLLPGLVGPVSAGTPRRRKGARPAAGAARHSPSCRSATAGGPRPGAPDDRSRARGLRQLASRAAPS